MLLLLSYLLAVFFTYIGFIVLSERINFKYFPSFRNKLDAAIVTTERQVLDFIDLHTHSYNQKYHQVKKKLNGLFRHRISNIKSSTDRFISGRKDHNGGVNDNEVSHFLKKVSDAQNLSDEGTNSVKK